MARLRAGRGSRARRRSHRRVRELRSALRRSNSKSTFAGRAGGRCCRFPRRRATPSAEVGCAARSRSGAGHRDRDSSIDAPSRGAAAVARHYDPEFFQRHRALVGFGTDCCEISGRDQRRPSVRDGQDANAATKAGAGHIHMDRHCARRSGQTVGSIAAAHVNDPEINAGDGC